jgi:hypothetical protein
MTELRERAADLPDELFVCLVGDMITEEALPTYMAMLNTLDGVRDETGRAQHPYAQWTRWAGRAVAGRAVAGSWAGTESYRACVHAWRCQCRTLNTAPPRPDRLFGRCLPDHQPTVPSPPHPAGSGLPRRTATVTLWAAIST